MQIRSLTTLTLKICSYFPSQFCSLCLMFIESVSHLFYKSCVHSNAIFSFIAVLLNSPWYDFLNLLLNQGMSKSISRNNDAGFVKLTNHCQWIYESFNKGCLKNSDFWNYLIGFKWWPDLKNETSLEHFVLSRITIN